MPSTTISIKLDSGAGNKVIKMQSVNMRVLKIKYNIHSIRRQAIEIE